MTDWVEQYHQEKQGQDQKGGPGSGHWGHAGRPGMVGGSAAGRMAGRGSVNREYFTKGPGKKVLASLTEEQRGFVIDVFTDLKVQPRYLGYLKAVTTEIPEGVDCEHWHNCEGIGYFSRYTQSIHINPFYLSKTTFDADFLSRPGRNILSHELGHYITGYSSWDATPEGDQSAGWDLMYDAWYNGGFRKGWRDEYAKTGLRPYSVKNFSEFMADSWAIYQYGDSWHRGNLRKALKVDSLDEVFGR